MALGVALVPAADVDRALAVDPRYGTWVTSGQTAPHVEPPKGSTPTTTAPAVSGTAPATPQTAPSTPATTPQTPPPSTG